MNEPIISPWIIYWITRLDKTADKLMDKIIKIEEAK